MTRDELEAAYDAMQLRELRTRRGELLRDIWAYACGPKPTADGACDAFDAEIAAMERELAEVERQIKVLCGQSVSHTPTPEPPQ